MHQDTAYIRLLKAKKRSLWKIIREESVLIIFEASDKKQNLSILFGKETANCAAYTLMRPGSMPATPFRMPGFCN